MRVIGVIRLVPGDGGGRQESGAVSNAITSNSTSNE